MLFNIPSRHQHSSPGIVSGAVGATLLLCGAFPSVAAAESICKPVTSCCNEIAGASRITDYCATPADSCATSSGCPTPAKEEKPAPKKFINRLRLGGYGEATFLHNFFSDDYKRYTDPKSYAHGSHSRFDLPHVCFYIGFDFGKGWSLGSEIEFEHGGVEAATEIETEEAGEYESEIERGGEVALEQLWIQKQFFPQLKVRAGMQVVPVGATNTHHEPDRFFGVFRPEGENTILPCTWHEVSLSVLGTAGKWDYQLMLLPGLDSDRFGNSSWIHYGAGSPYEFKIGNNVAVAARLDNKSVKGLRLGISGYIGNSFSNTLYTTGSTKTDGIYGTVTIASFDFSYDDHNVIARGYADYGHLSDAAFITSWNKRMPKTSPSKHQTVASEAVAAGVEAGYNFFGLSGNPTIARQKFYLFARYDYYDSMAGMESGNSLSWTHRSKISAGFNWMPIRQVIIKGEYSYGILDAKYKNEPAVALGVAYSGWFL